MDIVEDLFLLNGLLGDPNGKEDATGRGERVLGIARPSRFIDLEGDGVQGGAGEIEEIGIVGVLFAAFGDSGLECAKIEMSVHCGLLGR